MTPRLTYSLFMLLALGVFLFARRRVLRGQPVASLSWWQRAALAWAVFVGGVLGAKLPFVLGSSDEALTGSAWLADGKTITTGLIGGYLTVELTKLVLGIRIKTGDSFALPLALALAVGRWGCFFNGCCYGVPTALPWGVDFGDGIRRHPTQLYESLFHGAMALLLGYLLVQGALRTHQLQLYLMAYGVYRFATEFIRPEPIWALGLTFYQWAALTLALALAVQWLWESRWQIREQSLASALQG